MRRLSAVLLAGSIACASAIAPPRSAVAVPYVHDVAVLPARAYDQPKGDGKMALGDPDFNERFAKLMVELEGFRALAYDDYTGKRWATSAKSGDPTVGVGFNLSRPDADVLLFSVSAPTKRELLAGARMTKRQAMELVITVNQGSLRWLKKHFSGVRLHDHQWVTLASLAYNSRWRAGGPTLVGPKLTKAIYSGDWGAADHEIRNNSLGGIPANLKRGIQKRRTREADIFAGVEEEE